MKIAFITDTHVGARSSSSIFREYFKWWYEEHFFKKLKEVGCKEIIHAGDFFDNRNSVTLQDIDFVANWFAGKLREYDLNMIIVLGNHDVAYKNTNSIHSLTILESAASDRVRVCKGIEAACFDNQIFVLVPWINSSNYDDTLKFLSNVPNKKDIIVVGHFEIAGCKMYANSPVCEHGLDQSLFKEFKEVRSGHFHHKSKVGNIQYLGSAFHLNWQDYDDARGFHVHDTSDDSFTFYENEHSLFVQVAFDEQIFKDMTSEEYEESFGSRFVRLVVDGDYSKVALMDTIAKINRTKPHDLQVVNLSVLKETNESDSLDDVIERASKSTIEYINDFVKESEQGIIDVINDLYNRANEEMAKGE